MSPLAEQAVSQADGKFLRLKATLISWDGMGGIKSSINTFSGQNNQNALAWGYNGDGLLLAALTIGTPVRTMMADYTTFEKRMRKLVDQYEAFSPAEVYRRLNILDHQVDSIKRWQEGDEFMRNVIDGLERVGASSIPDFLRRVALARIATLAHDRGDLLPNSGEPKPLDAWDKLDLQILRTARNLGEQDQTPANVGPLVQASLDLRQRQRLVAEAAFEKEPLFRNHAELYIHEYLPKPAATSLAKQLGIDLGDLDPKSGSERVTTLNGAHGIYRYHQKPMEIGISGLTVSAMGIIDPYSKMPEQFGINVHGAPESISRRNSFFLGQDA